MKILMTGATGLVGTALGQALVAQGHEIFALLRSEKSIVHFPCTRVLKIEEALPKVDALINLAGANIAEKRWTTKRKKELYDSRVETTENIAKAALATGKKFKVVISASATGFYGDRGDEVVTEDSTPGEDFLAKLCVAWEKAAHDIPTERLVIPRLGVVLSPEGGFLKQVAPLFTMAGASSLGSGRQWFAWIHMHDLVAIFLKALSESDFSGVVNAVAPEFHNNSELTTELRLKLKTFPAPPVPKIVLQTLFGELSQALVGSQRVAPRVLQIAGFQWRSPTLRSALDEIYPELQTGEIQFVYTHWLPKTAHELWPFFSSEANLERLTPPFLNFKVVGKSSPEIHEGTKIDYRLSLHGVKFKWLTLISDWQKDHSFVDEQIKGPYQKWHHTHEFIPLAEGTLMRDTVIFKVPFGWLGRVAALKQVMKTVDSIFQYRTETIDQIFSTR